MRQHHSLIVEVGCYCGEPLKPYGGGWRHISTSSKWCYEEEARLDPDSRCEAMPDPDYEPEISK